MANSNGSNLDAVCVFLDARVDFIVATNVESLLGIHTTNCAESFHLQCPEWLDTIRSCRGVGPLEEFVAAPEEAA